MVKAVFLDRDGVINANLVRDGKPVAPTTLAEFRIFPDAAAATQRLKDAGFLLIVVTNQPDVRTGLTPKATMEAMHDRIRALMPIDDFEICFHTDIDNCACRKPRPGLLLRAAAKHGIALTDSIMIGDRWRDVLAGQAAGCRTIRIDHGYAEDRPSAPDRTVKSLTEAADFILKGRTDLDIATAGAASGPVSAAPSKCGMNELVISAALVVLWICGTTLAFYLKRSQLLIGFDGGYMMNLAQRQFEWHVPLLSASMDWFQGLGDIFFAVNFRLLPAFIVGSLFPNATLAKVAIYEVVLCELSLAIILFGLSLGASRAVSIAAALVTCLTFMPFAHPTLIYGILPLIPHTGSLIAAALLAGAAFIQFGRRSWLADLPFAAIALVLLAWSVLVSVTMTLLAAPFLFLCAVSGTIAARSSYERRCKIVLFAVAGASMVAPAIYLISTILDTAAVAFPAELANNRATFFFASILFQWKTVSPVGPLLMISGIVGAALAASDRTKPTFRIFAITLLTYLGSRLTFAILIILFDFWRGPAPLYFEFYVIPIYAIFAALFWGRVLEGLWRGRGWSLQHSSIVEAAIVGTAVVAILVLAAITHRTGWGFPYPPSSTQITKVLAQDSAMGGGAPFRGRTANMIGRSIDHSVDWLDLHAIDGSLSQMAGNELRLVGLNYFSIPSLFEYTSTITPFFYALTSRLLARPGDRQMRSIVVLRRINPRILAMLGVRFVITDREYGGPATLRISTPDQNRTLYLYELDRPNLGDYSPTVVTRLADATSIVERLHSADFDPKSEIIADVSQDSTKLVPARNARLTFLGASLRIEGDSDGRSILLLPLEFSRCLEAETNAAAKPDLFRANLMETGILFSGHLDATLSLWTGPFLDPACRLRDYFEARAMQIGDLPRAVGSDKPREQSN